MQNKKEENHWFIIIAVIIIIILVIAYSSVIGYEADEREKEIRRRDEEEKKLISELESLENKKQVYKKEEVIHAFNEKYMSDLCEKRYRQLIQILIGLHIGVNTLIFCFVPNMKILDLFTWNGLALGILNLGAIFFFASVKKGKEYLKGIAMNYIEYRVYGNRDKIYFTQKVKFYKEEIERVQKEIDGKRDALKRLKADDINTNNYFE